MEKTRLSLFYLAGYLILGGIMLLFEPRFSLKLLLSNGDYGDVFPRTAGMLLIGIGMLIVQIIRFRLSEIYTTTLVVRGFFFVCLVGFYLISKDPFFLVLLALLVFGIILTTINYLLDMQTALRAKSE
jgi:uncharacterized protein YjeT (DUF2065 family)